jgi:hypothetical protein
VLPGEGEPAEREAGVVSDARRQARNYDWDRLIWLFYDREFRLLEAWEWTVEEYRATLGALARLSQAHMRRGRRLFPPLP